MKRFFGPLLLAAVLSIAPIAATASAGAELLRLASSSVGRFLILETESGSGIATRVLGSRLEPGADLAPFLRRLGEPDMDGVARELETDLGRIEARYRENFPGATGLGPAERSFLEEQAIALLRIEPLSFPAAPPEAPGFAASREAFLHPEVPRALVLPSGLLGHAPAPLAESLRAGHWQEALWSLRESGQEALAGALEKNLETYLGQGAIAEQTVLGGGATETYLIRFHDGTLAVFKPAQVHWAANPGHEVGAYRLDRLLNLNRVPVTVERVIGGRAGSLQLFVPDAISADLASVSSPDRRINLFDYLIGNTDRHGANFLVLTRSGNRLVAIDHGLGFSLEDQPPYLLNPIRPDFEIYPRLLALDRAALERELGGLVEPDRIRAILARREYLLERVRSAIASQGEAAFFELPRPRR